MLEDLAIQYVSQDEGVLRLINYGLVIGGGVIAGIVTRSTVAIARAPYFAYTALILFAASAVEIVWLLSISAMTGGYLWVLMMVSVAATVAGGFFLCVIAMARSRDAHGHARMAFLAFIPLANFWLLFARPQNDNSASRPPTIRLLSGGLGVLTGFVLLGATAGVNGFIELQAQVLEQQVKEEPNAQQTGINQMIRSRGLEKTLLLMAAESPTPFTVDEVTTLMRIEAVGTQLTRRYVVDVDGWTVTDEFRARSRNTVCAWPPFEPILRAGGSIREVYVQKNGRESGEVMVTREECGF